MSQHARSTIAPVQRSTWARTGRVRDDAAPHEGERSARAHPAALQFVDDERHVVLRAQRSYASEPIEGRHHDTTLALCRFRDGQLRSEPTASEPPLRIITASQALREEKAVVLAAVRQNGYALRFCSIAALGHNVVLAAVGQKGNALAFAPEASRDDVAVVLAAVRQDGCSLRHASELLKKLPRRSRDRRPPEWRCDRLRGRGP